MRILLKKPVKYPSRISMAFHQTAKNSEFKKLNSKNKKPLHWPKRRKSTLMHLPPSARALKRKISTKE